MKHKKNTTEAWESYCKLMQRRPELFSDSETYEIIKNFSIVQEFENRTGRTIGVVYQSSYNFMVVDLVRVHKGQKSDKRIKDIDGDSLLDCIAYERIIPVETGGVVAVPVFQGKLILLKQYRHAIRQMQYAFPRGFGEKGLSSEQNLRKELQEEIGSDNVTNICHLGQIAPDSGISSGLIDAFSCDVDQVIEKSGYEGINGIVQLTPDAINKWIASGKINDGFTLGAFQMYQTIQLSQ